jgi:hypothetical protein
MLDAEILGAGLAEIVRTEVGIATRALTDEVADLKRQLADRDGQPLIETVRGMIADAVAAIPPQAAINTEALLATFKEAATGIAEAAAAALPAPKDGADGKDGRDGIDGKDGQPGESGADGIGMAAALIDKDGHLVVTNTRGETFALGRVVGSDGATGKDGERGADGCDGFSLDDFDTELKEDGRTVVFKFARGEVTELHEMQFPVVIDRGVYKDGSEYAKGDAATWAGSLWIAQRETTAKPGDGDDWRLAVKKGRDGKDGKDGAPGPQGKAGAPGKDGRAW